MFRVKRLEHEDEVKNEYGVERDSFAFFYLCSKNSGLPVMPTVVTLKLI